MKHYLKPGDRVILEKVYADIKENDGLLSIKEVDEWQIPSEVLIDPSDPRNPDPRHMGITITVYEEEKTGRFYFEGADIDGTP